MVCFNISLVYQMSIEWEAERLLGLVSTVSQDIHKLPRDNLEHLMETLNVSLNAIIHFD